MSIQIVDITRRTPVVAGKEEMKITYTGAVGGTEIFVNIVDANSAAHDGYIAERDLPGNIIYCREIPFMQGDFDVTLK